MQRKEANIVVRHQGLEMRVEQMAGMCKPKMIVWLNGSEKEKERLTQKALSTEKD